MLASMMVGENWALPGETYAPLQTAPRPSLMPYDWWGSKHKMDLNPQPLHWWETPGPQTGLQDCTQKPAFLDDEPDDITDDHLTVRVTQVAMKYQSYLWKKYKLWPLPVAAVHNGVSSVWDGLSDLWLSAYYRILADKANKIRHNVHWMDK